MERYHRDAANDPGYQAKGIRSVVIDWCPCEEGDRDGLPIFERGAKFSYDKFRVSLAEEVWPGGMVVWMNFHIDALGKRLRKKYIVPKQNQSGLIVRIERDLREWEKGARESNGTESNGTESNRSTASA